MSYDYNFFAIFLLTIFSYLFTFYLKGKGDFSVVIHRKIWNFVLLVSFLVSGLLGILLAFLIETSMSTGYYQLILWLHVELGIVMAVVSFFHLLWHVRYYFPKKKR